jgi:sec-independent protein translocase protein TatC
MAEPDDKKSADAAGAEGVSNSFISHLLELRNRIVYALVAVIAIFLVLAIGFSHDIYSLLAQPLLAQLPQGATMIATEVASPFLTPLRLTFAVSVVLAMPFLLYQIWAFVAPGLYKHEKRLIVPLVVSSVLLFYAGMAFAYFVVFPAVFHLMVSITPAGVTMMTDIKAYLDFVFSMFFAFGVAFEVPVAVVILVHLGVVSPETLAEKRAYVVLGIFVIAAVLTPPDVASQFLLAMPMWFLFEVGLFVARRWRPTDEQTATAGSHEPQK